MRYIFSIILIFQFILLKLIWEGIKVFLRIVLSQLKFFPFLYETGKNNHFEKDLLLSFIKSVQFVKFFLIEAEMVHKKIYSFLPYF